MEEAYRESANDSRTPFFAVFGPRLRARLNRYAAPMSTPRAFTLDTNYLEIPGTASAYLVFGPSAPVLVECGCAVAYDKLCAQLNEHGVRPSDLAGVFVTHIHLDHAGSAGHFAREGVPVFVHPRGARHLIDPARLIAGSRAVHGARYERHYGDPLPIAPDLVRAIDDGTTVSCGGLRWSAIETLGHARHHHAWALSHERSDAAMDRVFVGDVLGMISPGSSHISIPVPPSDIDIPAWRTSLARLRALPIGINAVLTHGGSVSLHTHLAAFTARMNEELPLLAELVDTAKADPLVADARYRDFLLPRAKAAGLSDALAALLLGKAFRTMNLAGIADSIAHGRFATSV
jgi:glyoxylase-like metal-dependent hydrolase (beta-lactamase superfamily II)